MVVLWRITFVRTWMVILFAVPWIASQSRHTNNWAILVCTSRFWFNYRHIANTLSMYRSIKRLGIPDSQIILMLADDMPCNARNPRPATVFNSPSKQINLYGDDVEVDYRGYEVTVENFIRVLTGRHHESVPRSKRLLTDETSNLLIYMSGHGGNGFLKFQDAEEITDIELADAIHQVWQKRRYNELMFLVDTCQAESLLLKVYSPNFIGAASSRIGQDSLSYEDDSKLGVHVIDRWTYFLLQYLEGVDRTNKKTLDDFFSATSDPYQIRSTPAIRTDLFKRELNKAYITDFFGSVRTVVMTNSTGVNEHVNCSPRRKVVEPVNKKARRLHYVRQFAASADLIERTRKMTS